jgi:hypothetical protein
MGKNLEILNYLLGVEKNVVPLTLNYDVIKVFRGSGTTLLAGCQ